MPDGSDYVRSRRLPIKLSDVIWLRCKLRSLRQCIVLDWLRARSQPVKTNSLANRRGLDYTGRSFAFRDLWRCAASLILADEQSTLARGPCTG